MALNSVNLYRIDGSLGSLSNIQTSALNGGPLAGFRNAIINGNFDHWQRGTSFTANDYGADRWVHGRTGTTHTATRQPFTVGQTDVPNEPTFFCRTVVTSVAGAGNYALLSQRIEDVRTFAGQQVTVSFWAKANATKNISVQLTQAFGTGGSPSAQVTDIGVSKVSIGTNWQRVTVTVTVPSISGKTLGTNNDHVFALNIWFDAGSSFDSRTDSLGQQSGTFDIAQVQVEPGPVATPFERRPIGTELALCQRYYTVSTHLTNSYPAQYGSVATFYGATVSLPVQMRTTPTASYSGEAGGADYWVIVGFSAYSANTLTSLTVITTNTSFKLVQPRTSNGVTPVGGNLYMLENGFSILLNAEL